MPDSTTNEPASNGFVQFLISSVDNIGEGHVVENDAAIFFDFNRPIITNSVVSTFVEHLDQDMDGFNFYEECDDLNPLINPNATEIVGNMIDENCDGILESTQEGENQSGPMACQDGIDNDQDGLVDCADPDCSTIKVCCDCEIQAPTLSKQE